jgi:hypothetical protein
MRYPNSIKEIGWYPVEYITAVAKSNIGEVISEIFDAFHWCVDIFDLPIGALHLK